jgi:hypothetical protein
MVSLGVSITLHLLLAFGAIGLFSRMGPAIDRILTQSAPSIDAAEEMLAILAESEGTLNEQQTLRFQAALVSARGYANLPRETPLIDAIAMASLSAEGPAAVTELVKNVRELGAINRAEMVTVGHQAQRLATAGAWASVLIALASFVLTIAVIARTQARVFAPIAELYAVAKAVRAGDVLRRGRMMQAPVELRELLAMLNFLLDEIHPRVKADAGVAGAGTVERLALLHFLEREPAPSFIVDDRGAVLASNSAGLELLSKREGDALRARLAGLPGAPLAGATRLGTTGWLCRGEPEARDS